MPIIEIEKAVDILQSGDAVAIPTETVYGLAANANDDEAVAKIYALKTRPQFNPLIIHVASLEQAEEIAIFNDTARALAEQHWAGGLSLVLPKRDKSQFMLASAGLDTIAIRCPAHATAQEILQKSALPLAAPSANISGKLSPTSAAHVQENFPDIYIVDGGECEVGLESTIIGFDNEQPVLLRHGVLQIPATNNHQPSTQITSPGQLIKHYSPSSPIRINADYAREEEVFIGFGAMECDYNLSKSANLQEAAANLFKLLHIADTQNKPIAVAKIPADGIGAAINDRLNRAASVDI